MKAAPRSIALGALHRAAVLNARGDGESDGKSLVVVEATLADRLATCLRTVHRLTSLTLTVSVPTMPTVTVMTLRGGVVVRLHNHCTSCVDHRGAIWSSAYACSASCLPRERRHRVERGPSQYSCSCLRGGGLHVLDVHEMALSSCRFNTYIAEDYCCGKLKPNTSYLHGPGRW